ncbi:MAG: hypothetical protein Kow0060_01740 [Methylohalobius crimeensis]
MSTDQKADFWQHHVAAWRRSQLSQKAYCQQNHLSYTRFCYWRTKFNQEKQSAPKFIPVATGPLRSSVTISLPAGIHLEVPAEALESVLPVIVRSVQE